MRNKRSINYIFLVLLMPFFGITGTLFAAPMGRASPSVITMKSPSTFIINEHEVASADLIKALKKNKIPTDTPLVIEVPADTPLDVIENLSQRLATAGFKPFYKYPRHAEVSVKDPKAPAPLTPQEKQSWRK